MKPSQRATRHIKYAPKIHSADAVAIDKTKTNGASQVSTRKVIGVGEAIKALLFVAFEHV